MASAAVAQPQSPPTANGSDADATTSSAASSSTSTSTSSSRDLPIRFGPVTKDNWAQLRRLQLAVFPVSYSDKFYRESHGEEVKPVTHLAYHNDVVIGAVCCRFEQPTLTAEKIMKREDQLRRIYIMTLGVLSPYRRYGIGRRLLQQILDYAQKTPDIGEVFLHVQTSNEAALAFYRQFGFTVTGTIPNYYKRIEPSDCYIVTRLIQH